MTSAKSKLFATVWLAISTSCLTPIVPAWAADNFVEAVANAKPILDMRLRYENVDQDGFSEDATAFTLRTRLGLETEEFAGFKFLLEFENVSSLGEENYNDTVNGKIAYPVIADPDQTELNRAQVTFSGIPYTTAILGRQRIKLDNDRFVGNVGWRQNEQTFDAFTLINKSLPDTTVIYAYVNKVHRVFGEDHPLGTLNGGNHIFNVKYAGLPNGTFTAYGIFLDVDEVATLSTQTLGARLTLSRDFNAVQLDLIGEFANQTDRADNPLTIDSNYWTVEASIGFDPLSVAGGVEVLEGDGTIAFQTPLATLHKFQGFADVFLTTPAAGIEDRYAKASYKFGDTPIAKSVAITAWYHDFHSDFGSMDLGSEFDAQLGLTFENNCSLLVKYADYDGGGWAADRSKLWVQLGFTY